MVSLYEILEAAARAEQRPFSQTKQHKLDGIGCFLEDFRLTYHELSLRHRAGACSTILFACGL